MELNATNRVIKNSFIIYIKLIFNIITGLFTTRLILNSLGETDYGIYILITGVVGMLSFLQGILSGTSMRFLSFNIGKGDFPLVNRTFNTLLSLHFVLGIVVLILIIIAGFFLFDGLLNIPLEKINEAKYIYYFTAITTLIIIISVPYDSIIYAHENLMLLSMVDILGSFLSLMFAIFILYTEKHQLIFYGLSILVIQIILRGIKQFYCNKNYSETKLSIIKNFDKVIFKQVLSLSLWTLVGAITSMASNQLQSFFLNMFFGVKINAANGLANNSAGFISNFSNSITSAIRPQLIKNEGSGNRDKMINLTIKSVKFSTFLFLIIGLPVFIELPYILKIWLTIVPDYTVVFGRLIIIASFLGLFSFEISTAIMAVGSIKRFTIIEASIIILSVVVGYLAFSIGYPPFTFYIIVIIRSFLIFSIRIYFGKLVFNLDPVDYISKAVIPVLVSLMVTLLFVVIPFFYITEEYLRFLLICIITMFSFILCLRYIGLTKDEYNIIKNLIIIKSNLIK